MTYLSLALCRAAATHIDHNSSQKPTVSFSQEQPAGLQRSVQVQAFMSCHIACGHMCGHNMLETRRIQYVMQEPEADVLSGAPVILFSVGDITCNEKTVCSFLSAKLPTFVPSLSWQNDHV